MKVKPFSKIILLALILLLLNFKISYVYAQFNQVFSDLQASHIFGESITFSSQVDAPAEIESAVLTFKPVATGRSVVTPATISGSTLIADYNLQPQDYIPPFGVIEYWFSVELSTGDELQSPAKTYQYADNRFTWQSLSHENSYDVNWVDGDQSFGQAVLDAVLRTLTSFSTYLDLPIPEKLSIFVYPTNSALQNALEITNAKWVAGHADPANNVILVAVPASFDQQLTIQRVVPHEITHIRLYLYLKDNYQNLPAWLSEGLASLSELYTLPEYWQILQVARQDGQLIPFEDLCSNFPLDSNNASLAYAQSDSFTRFIFKEYGKIGLQRLLDTYALGHPCLNGVSNAIDIDMQNLEKAWIQDTFRASILPKSAASALVWVILLLLLLLSPISYILLAKRK